MYIDNRHLAGMATSWTVNIWPWAGFYLEVAGWSTFKFHMGMDDEFLALILYICEYCVYRQVANICRWLE